MDIQSVSSSLQDQVRSLGTGVARDAQAAGGTGSKVFEAGKTTQPTEPVSLQQLDAAVKNVRAFVEPINTALEFSLSDESHQVVVKIIDRATKEVIRQIPSEEMIAISNALDSLKGLFVKQKV